MFETDTRKILSDVLKVCVVMHVNSLLGGKSIWLWGTCTSPMPAANTSRPSSCLKSIVATVQTTFPSWKMCHASSKVHNESENDETVQPSQFLERTLSLISDFPPPPRTHRAYGIHTASCGRPALSQRFPGQFGIPGVPVHPVHPARVLSNALPRAVSMAVTKHHYRGAAGVSAVMLSGTP